MTKNTGLERAQPVMRLDLDDDCVGKVLVHLLRKAGTMCRLPAAHRFGGGGRCRSSAACHQGQTRLSFPGIMKTSSDLHELILGGQGTSSRHPGHSQGQQSQTRPQKPRNRSGYRQPVGGRDSAGRRIHHLEPMAINWHGLNSPSPPPRMPASRPLAGSRRSGPAAPTRRCGRRA